MDDLQLMYFNYFNAIEKGYPEVYLKLMDLPDASISGIINDMVVSRVDLKVEESVKSFFSNRPQLVKFVEIL